MTRQHSIVTHKANYFYRILEDDYLLMYQLLAGQLDPIKEQQKKKLSASSDCKAMIASILENWMNSKRPNARNEEDLYVYFTIDDWIAELRGHYNRSTIIQCLKEMEEEGTFADKEGKVYTGTIIKRPYVQNTFMYCLNLPVIQAMIEALPEQSPFDAKPHPALGRPKKSSTNLNHLNLNGLKTDFQSLKTDDSSLKTDGSTYITKITKTDKEDLSADADSARALFFHPVYSFLAFDSFEHPTTMTIFFEDDEQAEITNKGYGHIAEEIANQMTTMGTPLKVVTAKRQYAKTIDADSARDTSSSQQNENLYTLSDESSPVTDFLEHHVTDASKEDVQLSPTHVDKQASSGDKPPKPNARQKRSVAPKDETPTPPSKPVEPSAEMVWGTRKCLQWFDFWRGGILISKYKLMEASKCAKGLAEQFTEDQVIQVRNMMMDDPFWIAQGSVDVCHVANNIHKYLARAQKPAGKPKLAVVASNGVDYNAAIFDTSRNYIQGGEEELARLEAQYAALKARKKQAAR